MDRQLEDCCRYPRSIHFILCVLLVPGKYDSPGPVVILEIHLLIGGLDLSLVAWGIIEISMSIITYSVVFL